VQAEWFMEGLLERLTSGSDAVARALLRQAVVYAVPNMNPDGSYRGHLRTNAAGRLGRWRLHRPARRALAKAATPAPPSKAEPVPRRQLGTCRHMVSEGGSLPRAQAPT
jgi:hypothetical protein